jgi:hypothetical protein
MLFNVPQFIDVEDKVAGPLTAKQLFWMFGMGATLFVLYVFLERTVFFIVAVPTVALFCAFAFWKPYNMPLLFMVYSGILFLFRPKVYTWQRSPDPIQRTPKREVKKEKTEEKKLTASNIAALAQTLDSDGMKRNEQIEKLLMKKKK